MNKNPKLMLIGAAFLIALMMLTPAHAYLLNNFDEKHGTYSSVYVGVAGNYVGGKLGAPAAYVKGVVDVAIPGGYSLRVYYYFEWEDLNYHIFHKSGYVEIPGTQGNWVRIPATEVNHTVYYIVAEGRNWINGNYDTDWAS
ncbi:MAG TPA: hypothetical protein VMS94_03435, partial [Acidobacteriota bacterium]|nr:hypothetical protein [Acidobacteriota bacterium]